MNKRWVLFFLVFTAAYFFALVVPEIAKKSEQTQAADEAARAAEAAAAVDDAARPEPGTLAIGDADTSPTLRTASAPGDRPAAPERVVPAESATPLDFDPVWVETDVVRVAFSPLGAVPVSWEVLPTDRIAPVRNNDDGTTVVVDLVPQVRNPGEREWPLQLVGRNVEVFNRVVYDVERRESEESIELRFTSPVVDDLQVVRTVRFGRDSYVTELEVEVRNGDVRTRIGDADIGWGLGWQGGFLQPEVTSRYTGRIEAVASVGGRLRLKAMKLGDAAEIHERNVAWAGQEKKYFMAVLVPDALNPPLRTEYAVRRRNMTPEFQERNVQAPMSVTIYHAGVELQPGDSARLTYRLVAGPKDYGVLNSLELSMVPEGLPISAMVFGSMPLGQDWLRPICLLLLRMLRWFEGLVNNWGLAIILLVVVVKTILYPLSHWAIKNQAKTMAEQARIKPELDALTKKYKDDPSKRSQEMMKLYREHNINPLGVLRGCFPILLQMPVFFALYILLDQAVELRGQSFLWIVDLTAPDRLIPLGFKLPLLGWDAINILPILMAITQYFSSKLMMTNVTDPMQRQIMLLMPVFFVFILYTMPAGLMLYWTVQNIWQIGHTVLTKRTVAMEDSAHRGTPAPAATAAKPRASRTPAP